MKLKISVGVFLFLSFLGAVFFWREFFLSSLFSSAYRQEAYGDAETVLLTKAFLEAADLHNLGNTLYKQSLSSTAEQKSLERALFYYSGSLKKQEHPDTRYNYEFVKKLLDTFQSQEQEKQEESQESQEEEQPASQQEQKKNTSQSGATTGSGDSPTEDTPTQPWEEQSSVLQNARADQYRLQEDQTLKALSPQEQAALEQAIEELQQEQVYNQRFFWKQGNGKTDFEKRFESLFGWSEEKDW